MPRLGTYEVQLATGFRARLQLDHDDAKRRYPTAVEVKTPADGEVKTKARRKPVAKKQED